MSSFCLHASLEALAPLGNSIVNNPLIQSHPHTRLHPSHSMASYNEIALRLVVIKGSKSATVQHTTKLTKWNIFNLQQSFIFCPPFTNLFTTLLSHKPNFNLKLV